MKENSTKYTKITRNKTLSNGWIVDASYILFRFSFFFDAAIFFGNVGWAIFSASIHLVRSGLSVNLGRWFLSWGKGYDDNESHDVEPPVDWAGEGDIQMTTKFRLATFKRTLEIATRAMNPNVNRRRKKYGKQLEKCDIWRKALCPTCKILNKSFWQYSIF